MRRMKTMGLKPRRSGGAATGFEWSAQARRRRPGGRERRRAATSPMLAPSASGSLRRGCSLPLAPCGLFHSNGRYPVAAGTLVLGRIRGTGFLVPFESGHSSVLPSEWLHRSGPKGRRTLAGGFSPRITNDRERAAKSAPETFQNHFGLRHHGRSRRRLRGAFPSPSIQGLKPPASIRRPFGPETTLGIRSHRSVFQGPHPLP